MLSNQGLGKTHTHNGQTQKSSSAQGARWFLFGSIERKTKAKNYIINQLSPVFLYIKVESKLHLVIL